MVADAAFPFPIWAMEFGATYPFRDKAPRHLGLGMITGFKGSFGCSLKGKSEDEVEKALPA